MKSTHEHVAEKANQDLKLNGMQQKCNVWAGYYNYDGKCTDQIRLNCSTPESLIKAKQVVEYVKWTDLTSTTAASGEGV